MTIRPLVVALAAGLLLSNLACEDFAHRRAESSGQDQQRLRDVWVAEIRLLETGPAAVAKLSQLLERAAAVPGVKRAAVVDFLPGGERNQTHIVREGDPLHMPTAAYAQVVSSGYFDTMNLRLLRGRLFERDTESGPAVAIVNESYASFFPSPAEKAVRQDLLGRRVKVWQDSDPWLTIVGIVQDGPGGSRGDAVLYVPLTQLGLYGPSRPWNARSGKPPWYILARTAADQKIAATHLQEVEGVEFSLLEERLEADSKN
jgi:hypothetical protein